MKLRRLFQVLIHEKLDVEGSTKRTLVIEKLTKREENAVRYMAGYIIIKMKKKYSLHDDFYGSICGSGDSHTSIDTLADYTRIWTEQVNRAGLA